MTAKDYLSRAHFLKNAIEYKHEQILMLQSLATRATGVLEAVRVGGTPCRSKLEDTVTRLVDLKDELRQDMSDFADAFREISQVIDDVPDLRFRELLTLRYLNFKSFSEIEIIMKYTYNHIVRDLHPRALKAVSIPPCRDARACDIIQENAG